MKRAISHDLTIIFSCGFEDLFPYTQDCMKNQKLLGNFLDLSQKQITAPS